jgi:hypothetical protein
MELIDIETDLSEAQVRNLLKGRTALLKPNIFNKNPQNILRLLQSTITRIDKAHRKGKGAKLVLQPSEDLIHTTKGGKIKFKNPFKKTKDLFEDLGKEVKSKSKIVKRKFDEKIVDSGIGKKMASELIDIGTQIVLPAAGSALSMAMGDPSGMSGAMVGQMAGDQLNKQAQRDGYGLFKAMHKAGFHKVGINKTNVIKRAKKVGKQFIEESANIGGDAITAYTGNPMVGETFKMAAKKLVMLQLIVDLQKKHYKI